MQELRFTYFREFTKNIRKTRPRFYISPEDNEDLTDDKVIEDAEKVKGESSEGLPYMNLSQIRKHIEKSVKH